MLFGDSTDGATADKLLETCWEAGCRFFDTAEMYPVPQRSDTYGGSERMLGTWLRQGHRRREDALVSTKVSAGLPFELAGSEGTVCMTLLRGGALDRLCPILSSEGTAHFAIQGTLITCAKLCSN
jgi:hypothetical protein